jgi:hypothetical protein
VKGEALLNQFQELAERLDITIVQGKGDFVGGGCTVNSRRFIVLNKVRPLEQRLRILAREFANLDLEGVYVVPALRAYIEEQQLLPWDAETV